jgi:autotransporter-associated beta strand protein
MPLKPPSQRGARPPSFRRPWWLGHVVASLVLPTFACAQAIWDNNNGTGNSQWTTANNWNPNSIPGNTNNIIFNGTEGTDATVNDVELRGTRTVNSLTFTSVDDNFSLVNGTGSRTLNLTSGDITRDAGSSGVQTLAFSTLALGGASAMDIAGTGSLNISAAITGAQSLTKTGVGELVLSGTNTYSGGTTINAGTLTVQSAGALGSGSTVTLGGGRLRLDTASTTITNLNLTGNSIIDFATAATLNVGTLNLGAFTLTVENWTHASDFFFATVWTGAVTNTEGIAPMNQVVFSNFPNNNTVWMSFDNQIASVPEPSTYGAILLGALTGLFAWRRLVRRPAR